MNSTSESGAVLYFRTACEQQEPDANESLDTQESLCRAYCEKLGWAVKATFADTARSGPLSDGPGFVRLLFYIKANQNAVRYVVVNDLSRLGHSLTSQAKMIRTLAYCGVLVRSTWDGDIDDSAIGKLEADLADAFRRFDAAFRSQE